MSLNTLNSATQLVIHFYVSMSISTSACSFLRQHVYFYVSMSISTSACPFLRQHVHFYVSMSFSTSACPSTSDFSPANVRCLPSCLFRLPSPGAGVVRYMHRHMQQLHLDPPPPPPPPPPFRPPKSPKSKSPVTATAAERCNDDDDDSRVIWLSVKRSGCVRPRRVGDEKEKKSRSFELDTDH
jgi:hypothetical protein